MNTEVKIEKYYTPKIEEFHVYFEYEFHVITTGGIVFFDSDGSKDKAPDIKVWIKEFVNSHPFFMRSLYDIEVLIQSGQIRVKYLDKEDIESLGWKHSFDDAGTESPNLQDEHGYSLGFSIDQQSTPSKTAYILHYFPDNFLIIDSIVNSGSGREDMLFRGFVKNKSELKRLLTQLNINF